jgi:hypothetical protein
MRQSPTDFDVGNHQILLLDYSGHSAIFSFGLHHAFDARD